MSFYSLKKKTVFNNFRYVEYILDSEEKRLVYVCCFEK